MKRLAGGAQMAQAWNGQRPAPARAPRGLRASSLRSAAVCMQRMA